MYAQNYSPSEEPEHKATANGVAVLGQSLKTDAIFGMTTATGSVPDNFAGVVGQDNTNDPNNVNNAGVVGLIRKRNCGCFGPGG